MPLTSETLKGMWAGLPVPWDAEDQLDEASLRENVRRVCKVGVHGVYTHGTTGEFYAQSEEEWKRVVDATVEASRPWGIPTQIGCTALWTAEVIRRVAYSQKAGADGVQIAFPFWMELTDAQAIRFLNEVTSAVPGMPIIIYNTERSKKPLTADLLKRLMDVKIPVIGCKGVRSPEELQAFKEIAPQIVFFVGENNLADYWKFGARGVYSSFIYACPRFMLRYFKLCEEGNPEAFTIGKSLQRFINEFVVPRYQKGMYDTGFDRTFAVMTGFLTGSLLLSRPPYDASSPKLVEECREWFAQNLPEFINEV
jgi:dihydrodipicolinate synthase/N-acetylneuraminate lyase